MPGLDDHLHSVLGGGGRGRRRRWLVVAAAAAATLLGVALLSRRRVDPCTQASRKVEEVWSGAHGVVVRAAFARAAPGWSALPYRRTASGLDAYAESWVRLRRAVCEDHHVPAAVHDRQTACLRQRRAELGALIAVLITADRDTVARAVDAVAALTPVAVCAGDPPGPSAALPADARQVARIRAADERLDELVWRQRTGRQRGLAELAGAALAEARATGYAPLIGRALLVVSGSQPAAAAEASLAEALALASRLGDDRLAAEVWVNRIERAGDRPELAAIALGWSRFARAALAGAGDPRLRARLLTAEAAVLSRAGRSAEAVERWREVVVLRERASGAGVGVATARGGLCAALLAAGRAAEAEPECRGALAGVERALGGEHPDAIAARRRLASSLAALGRDPEAAPGSQAPGGVDRQRPADPPADPPPGRQAPAGP